MAYVVTEKCIKCDNPKCAVVCPMDCFYKGENMLGINQEECIDCGACEYECPNNAIKSDTEEGVEIFIERNIDISKKYPKII